MLGLNVMIIGLCVRVDNGAAIIDILLKVAKQEGVLNVFRADEP